MTLTILKDTDTKINSAWITFYKYDFSLNVSLNSMFLFFETIMKFLLNKYKSYKGFLGYETTHVATLSHAMPRSYPWIKYSNIDYPW